jgi:hypothetical protein
MKTKGFKNNGLKLIVGYSVWMSVRKTAIDSVANSISDYAKNCSLWDSVHGSVWNSVQNSVRNSIRSSVVNSIKTKVKRFSTKT